MCIALLNHADRVKTACLAQLVNVIAPIMTETGGAAWRQTIFWPFAHFSNFGRGRVLRAQVDAPTYAATYYDPRGAQDLYFPLPQVPYLKLAAVHDEQARTLTLFALNRSLTDEMPLRVTVEGLFKPRGRARHFSCATLTSKPPTPGRSRSASSHQRSRPCGCRERTLRGILQPASWNVIRVKVQQ